VKWVGLTTEVTCCELGFDSLYGFIRWRPARGPIQLLIKSAFGARRRLTCMAQRLMHGASSCLHDVIGAGTTLRECIGALCYTGLTKEDFLNICRIETKSHLLTYRNIELKRRKYGGGGGVSSV
jgi:hypothetical protein